MDHGASPSDFASAYRHGFARVAACTIPVAAGDPAGNAAAIVEQVRGLHEDGVAVALFPELSLSGYAIDDLLLQDVLLDEVDRAVVTVAAATKTLLPVVVVGAPLRHGNRLFNCAVVIHRGEVLGVVPKSNLPNYREFYEKRHFAAGDDTRSDWFHAPHWPGPTRTATCRSAPTSSSRPTTPGLGRPRGDLRGHVGAGAAERQGRARGRHRAAQPVGVTDHGRSRRGPPPARPLRERAVQRRLPVCRRVGR